jgi:hypothetical protein
MGGSVQMAILTAGDDCRMKETIPTRLRSRMDMLGRCGKPFVLTT